MSDGVHTRMYNCGEKDWMRRWWGPASEAGDAFKGNANYLNNHNYYIHIFLLLINVIHSSSSLSSPLPSSFWPSLILRYNHNSFQGTIFHHLMEWNGMEFAIAHYYALRLLHSHLWKRTLHSRWGHFPPTADRTMQCNATDISLKCWRMNAKEWNEWKLN